jgi:hypothetical protein
MKMDDVEIVGCLKHFLKQVEMMREAADRGAAG